MMAKMILSRNKKVILFVLTLVLVVSPVLSSAAESSEPFKIIPTCANDDCGFYDLLALINNIVDFVIMISLPIAAGVIAWAGFNMMMDAGNGSKRKESIEMIKKVMIGFAIILVSWIVVSTLLGVLLKGGGVPEAAIKVAK